MDCDQWKYYTRIMFTAKCRLCTRWWKLHAHFKSWLDSCCPYIIVQSHPHSILWQKSSDIPSPQQPHEHRTPSNSGYACMCNVGVYIQGMHIILCLLGKQKHIQALTYLYITLLVMGIPIMHCSYKVWNEARSPFISSIPLMNRGTLNSRHAHC